jgi:hypothetical protein
MNIRAIRTPTLKYQNAMRVLAAFAASIPIYVKSKISNKVDPSIASQQTETTSSY